ncbi:MAG: alpha/beta hydrolase [Pseudomonadota bacterium]
MAEDDEIYGGYTQTELDALYDQFHEIPEHDRYVERWESWSQTVREKWDFETLSYGESPRQRIDLFHGNSPDAGLVVFFHGGAWQRHTKEQFHYIADSMVTDGFAYAAVDFDSVPDVPFETQIEEAVRAVEFLIKNAHGYSGESIYLVGHAAGAHLAAMAVTTNWPKRLGTDSCPLKGGMLISGIYDLDPIQHTKRNEYLHLSTAMIQAYSPIQRVLEHPCPLVIGWGSDEGEELKRQSQDFAAAWRRVGGRCNAFELPRSNHLDMSLELGDADGPLLSAFLNLDAEAT